MGIPGIESRDDGGMEAVESRGKGREGCVSGKDKRGREGGM